MTSSAVREPPFAQFGPYEVRSTLGQGGMGIIYVGEHIATGQRAAIKTVRLPDAGLLSGLRREIHAIAHLKHPGVVRILDQGVDDGIPWYAMDLLEGRTLADLFADLWQGAVSTDSTRVDDDGLGVTLQSDGPDLDAPLRARLPAPFPRRCAAGGRLMLALDIVRELCVTLAYVHGEGIVHRDLKPDNILLAEGDAPVLLDFGLASRSPGAVGREVLEVTSMEGTAWYIAPELVNRQLVDARSDLYAVGCMLYEAVTGRPPFVETSVRGVLMMHLSMPPERPSDLVDGVPPALEDLILRLLAKEPRRRPGHANDIARALASFGATALRRGALAPARAYVYRPELAGRSVALDDLALRLEHALAGHGGLTLIRGESGIGKTYLAMALARAAVEQHALVITGACVAVSTPTGDEAPVSSTRLGAAGRHDARLHPFRPFLQAVADRCLAEGPAVVEALLGDRGGVLAAASPEIALIVENDAASEPEALPAEAAHERLLLAFAETLVVFSRRQPLLLILDDLQWADELSLDLLALLAGERLTSHPVLIVGTYRADEATPALCALEDRAGVHRVALERLDAASVGRMVSDMLALDPAPPALVSFLARQSAGNPFFVAEYLRTAVAEGLLRRSAEGRWEVAEGLAGATAYDRLPLPGSLRELIIHHLDGLSPEAKELAFAASVIGRDVDTDLLHEVARSDEAATLSALGELALRQILEPSGPGRLRFLHDKLRETAYAQIPVEAQRTLHLRAGLAIEAAAASGSVDPSRDYARLAHHFTRAGATPKALEYLEKAAHEALESYANREAVGFLHDFMSIALAALLGPAGARDGRQVASVLRIVSRSRVSERERLRFARAERQLTEAYRRLSDLAKASHHASLALAWAGRPQPMEKRGWILRLLREAPLQAARRLVPGAFQIEADAIAQESRREAARALLRVTEIAYLNNDGLPLFAGSVWCANEAEAAGGSVTAGRPYAVIGLVLSTMGLFRAAERYFALARATSEHTGDPAALAYGQVLQLLSLMWQARWDEGRATSQVAEAFLERTGDHHTREFVWILSGMLEGLSCRFASSVASFRRAIASARERGSRFHLGLGLMGAAFSLQLLGGLDEAERMLDEAIALRTADGDMGTLVQCHASLARIHLRRGDIEAALAAADSASSLVRGRLAPLAQLMWCGAVLDVYLARWAQTIRDRPGEAARARAEVRRTLARLFACTLRMPVSEPSYHLYRGAARRLDGAERRARASFARALASAERIGTPHVEASARLELARGERPGSPARREHLGRAEALFEQLGCPQELARCRELRDG